MGIDTLWGVSVVVIAAGFSLFLVKWLWTADAPLGQMIQRNRKAVVAGNVVAYMCFILGTIGYITDFFDDKDWRGLGITFGAGVALAMVVVIGLSAISGPGRVKEGLIALAWSNWAPPFLFYPLSFIAISLGFVSALSLISK